MERFISVVPIPVLWIFIVQHVEISGIMSFWKIISDFIELFMVILISPAPWIINLVFFHGYFRVKKTKGENETNLLFFSGYSRVSKANGENGTLEWIKKMSKWAEIVIIGYLATIVFMIIRYNFLNNLIRELALYGYAIIIFLLVVWISDLHRKIYSKTFKSAFS